MNLADAHKLTTQHLNYILRTLPGGYLELRALKRREDANGRMDSRGSHYLRSEPTASELNDAVDWCNRLAKDGAEIYVGYNARDHENAKTKAEVSMVSAVYADLDAVKAGRTIKAALEVVQTAPVVPHLVVNSGYGLQAVWFVKATASKEQWQAVQRAVATYFADYGGDQSVAPDESRVLRLVPYPNLKNGTKRLTRIEVQSQPTGALDLALLGERYHARANVETKKEKALEKAAEASAIIDHHRNNALTSLAGWMKRAALMDENAIHAALAEVNRDRCIPPLADSEVRMIVRSVMRYSAQELLTIAGGDETEEDDDTLVRPLASFLTEKFDDVEPLIFGLHRRELGMLNSLPNAGKTTLCLNFCMSASAGLPYPPFTISDRPLRILYLDFENRAVRLQRDVSTMLEFFGESYRPLVEQNLFITVDKRFGNIPLTLTDPVHLQKIARLAAVNRIDLIIVDTLSAAVSLINENDNAEVKRKVIEPFQALANYANAAILFIHHVGKGNESDNAGVYQYRGASVLGAYCRLVLKIKPDINTEDAIVVQSPKVKGMPFDDHIFILDRAARWFKHTDLTVPTTPSAYQHIIRIVNASDGIRRKVIMDQLKVEGISISEDTIKRRLREAVERGDVAEYARSVYGPIKSLGGTEGPLTDGALEAGAAANSASESDQDAEDDQRATSGDPESAGDDLDATAAWPPPLAEDFSDRFVAAVGEALDASETPEQAETNVLAAAASLVAEANGNGHKPKKKGRVKKDERTAETSQQAESAAPLAGDDRQDAAEYVEF